MSVFYTSITPAAPANAPKKPILWTWYCDSAPPVLFAPTLPVDELLPAVVVLLVTLPRLKLAVRCGAPPLWMPEISVRADGAEVDVLKLDTDVEGDRMRFSVEEEEEPCWLDDIPTSDKSVVRRRVDLRIVV
jgi:hypothetical protein